MICLEAKFYIMSLNFNGVVCLEPALLALVDHCQLGLVIGQGITVLLAVVLHKVLNIGETGEFVICLP